MKCQIFNPGDTIVAYKDSVEFIYLILLGGVHCIINIIHIYLLFYLEVTLETFKLSLILNLNFIIEDQERELII